MQPGLKKLQTQCWLRVSADIIHKEDSVIRNIPDTEKRESFLKRSGLPPFLYICREHVSIGFTIDKPGIYE